MVPVSIRPTARQLRPGSQRRAGFSLFEVMIVVVVLSLLAGLALPRVSAFQARSRDARRVQDLGNLQEAIEAFRRDLGRYPASPNESGGWDTSGNGDLAQELITEGYWRNPLGDPIEDGTYEYRYQVHAQGDHGCAGAGPYYVLGIRRFETDWATDRFQSNFRCSGRDWADQFDFVTGGGASYTAAGPPSGPGL